MKLQPRPQFAVTESAIVFSSSGSAAAPCGVPGGGVQRLTGRTGDQQASLTGLGACLQSRPPARLERRGAHTSLVSSPPCPDGVKIVRASSVCGFGVGQSTAGRHITAHIICAVRVSWDRDRGWFGWHGMAWHGMVTYGSGTGWRRPGELIIASQLQVLPACYHAAAAAAAAAADRCCGGRLSHSLDIDGWMARRGS